MVTTLKVDLAIIGAGSAGMSAYSEARKHTDQVLLINDGPYGTTCARVGCMPSKAFIQIANDFYRRNKLKSQGIHGGEKLRLNGAEAMQHVRELRDYFVSFVLRSIEQIGENNLQGKAKFVDVQKLQVGNTLVEAEKIIIATGSSPFIPDSLKKLGDVVLTSDDFFELKELPNSMAVVGSGIIGLELGQALHRLGVETTVFGRSRSLAGLKDPATNAYMAEAFAKEFPLVFSPTLEFQPEGRHMAIRWNDKKIKVEKILAATGRKANVSQLGLEAIGVPFNEEGVPLFNPETMQIANLPLFIAGDVNSEKALLHEASDEGRIAAWNATHPIRSFRRRTPLSIAFSEPNIAQIGIPFDQLDRGRFEVGELRFDSQGRSVIMQKNKGILRVYADKKDGRLLGAELAAPSGEHLAHLLSWAIEARMTVFDALAAPFYHPVVEEGLRTALRDLGRKIPHPQAQALETRFIDS